MEDIREASSMKASCSVPECGRGVIAKGLCTMHYARMKRNGSEFVLHNAPHGTGSVRKDGYRAYRRFGIESLEHREIAEKAIGRKLPKGAEVHHVNSNRGDSNPNNLVICQNRAYHQLIHQRTRALDACGKSSWLKCVYCKKYDDPSKLSSYTNKNGSTNQFHAQCKRDSAKANYHTKKGLK